MLVAHADFETGSPVDLKKCGLHIYAAHQATRVWTLQWRIIDTDTGQIIDKDRWRPDFDDKWIQPLLDHVARGGRFVAHNAAFERHIWNTVVCRDRPHWPRLTIEQMDCTMARAAVLAIPQSLEIVGQVLGTKAQKDMAGTKAMLRMAKPRAFKDGVYSWFDDEETWSRNEQYCDVDVDTECEIDTRLPPLSKSERLTWEFDQVVNDRGVLLDRTLIQKALAVREAARKLMDDRIAVVTKGVVTKCSQVARIVKWINDQGLSCESIAKDERPDLLDAAFARGMDDVLEVLELRAQAGQVSPTAKFSKMLDCMGDDDRARGLFHYHGGSTGRWAGRLIQVHNLYRVDPDRDGKSIEWIRHIVATMDPEAAAQSLLLMFGSPLAALAKMTRQMIIARRGAKLVGADLSNIEGRLSAWFAGELWKLDAFAEYDAGRGPDLYRVAYARSFGIKPEDVIAWQRQIGKVMELALGYQGSVGSFISMARVYGLKISALVPAVMAAAPDDFSSWMDRYAAARDKRGLPAEQWAAVKVVVTGWRKAHAKLEATWYELQDAAIEAVSNPGAVIGVMDNKGAYCFARGFLWAYLPNGAVLAYCNARVIQHREYWYEFSDGAECDMSLFLDPVFYGDLMTASDREQEEDRVAKLIGATKQERKRRRVDYDGYEGERKIWTSFSLYGGMQFNHFVQGTARGVMRDGLIANDLMGYDIVMHVHDEGLAEVSTDFGSADDFANRMITSSSWLTGCPLAAKGWEGDRYVK